MKPKHTQNKNKHKNIMEYLMKSDERGRNMDKI